MESGSYQPSNDLMLRFYAYYKQATLGPCTGKRPAFYDVVGRAKYDAWKGLGNMTKTAAMAKYVDELHTIVETMSYSDKVANFLEAPTEDIDCVNMIMDDLELIAGDVLENVRSRPNSPFASRENSPIRIRSSRDTSPVSTPSSAPEESDHSDDEYIDTIEFPDAKKTEQMSNGYVPKEHVSRARTKSQTSVDVSQEVSKAVQNLKADIDKLTNKIHSLERSTVAVRKSRFAGMSVHLIAFIIAWPFLASFIMNRYVFNRK
ncbi:acyl-CoA-binding domain-containing protein 5A [Asbolus verrucosus]|uniref:Acyl-CoA-binding domain-containing protein 5A n=1 Tax=Asbolus verrucosus TaxID=1661398 RepID=A0A482VSA8_ASBVE|nr:acyl-CoA-binding domain-containing protein 5A [Asbolus verrucosus]